MNEYREPAEGYAEPPTQAAAAAYEAADASVTHGPHGPGCTCPHGPVNPIDMLRVQVASLEKSRDSLDKYFNLYQTQTRLIEKLTNDNASYKQYLTSYQQDYEDLQWYKSEWQKLSAEKKNFEKRLVEASNLDPLVEKESRKVVDRNNELKAELQTVQEEKAALQKSNDELRSRVVSACMSRDSDTFKNLSDAYRHDRAVDEFRSLWSNERLDALEALEDADLDDKLACRILSRLMEIALDQVQIKVKKLLDDVQGAIAALWRVELPESTSADLELAVKNRLKASFAMLKRDETVQLVIASLVSDYAEAGEALKQSELQQFTRQTVHVAWMLSLQAPALSLETGTEIPFNASRHQIYSDCIRPRGASEVKIDFFVWPTLLSGEGNVLEKGVVYV